jgi:hypothetical protein
LLGGLRTFAMLTTFTVVIHVATLSVFAITHDLIFDFPGGGDQHNRLIPINAKGSFSRAMQNAVNCGREISAFPRIWSAGLSILGRGLTFESVLKTLASNPEWCLPQ